MNYAAANSNWIKDY